MAYFFGGKQLEPGKPFSAGGTMFPGNYLDLSTLEEKKALGITEQEDPEPVRIAGDGPTPSTEENSLTNTTNTTPFPETDVDASTKEFLDSLGQDFFDQYLKPQYAGDRLNVQDGRLNYNKPENQKGGVIRYARPDQGEHLLHLLHLHLHRHLALPLLYPPLQHRILKQKLLLPEVMMAEVMMAKKITLL